MTDAFPRRHPAGAPPPPAAGTVPGAALAAVSAAILAAVLAAPLPARADAVDVDAEALRALVDAGVAVVDVRRPDEWADTGVIEGSHLLTFFDERGEHDASAWLAALDEVVGAGEPVVLICRTGRRTDAIDDWLAEARPGATVRDAAGGIVAWRRAGGETVEPPR